MPPIDKIETIQPCESKDNMLTKIKEDVDLLIKDNRTSHDSLLLARCNLDQLDSLVNELDFEPLYGRVDQLDVLLEDRDERAV